MGVWESDVVPLLKADEKGVLQSTTLLKELQLRYPGKFIDGQLRTLQRQVRDWRAIHGPEKEVFFPQEHPPGREAGIDFTHANSLEVIVAGQPLKHLFFELKLSYSGWTWVGLAYSETFEALVEGVQAALWELGGCPQVLRHDNLSAATHELKRSGGRALNARFKAVLEHYQIRSTRSNVGKGHENGVAEKGHDLVKKAVAQHLVLRGSKEFESASVYEEFVRNVVRKVINQANQEKLTLERQHLLALPSSPVPNYTLHQPKVSRWSTIRVARRSYSVPSRLIGHQVQVKQYANHLEVSYRDSLIEEMPRLRGAAEVSIDYRHIIWSLVRKPGAFARYRYREELFPSFPFRRAYDLLSTWRGERADVEYVRILHLAASTMESQVEGVLRQLIEGGQRFDYAKIKALVKPEPSKVPQLSLPELDLSVYDRLLGGAS
jgi:hypothetical protein